MRKVLIYLFFIFCGNVYSQNIQLSNKAEVSIITVGQGENLYDSFGHSAIRIKDKANRLDRVYNYGTYNFNTPNFYTKFAQGKLLYDLSSYPFYYFLKAYINENRSVSEQILDLSLTEKQNYFNYLENNAKPENKKYLYDFFYDNCATKIREVNSNVLGKENLNYHDSILNENKTFRNLIHQKLNNQPWGKFGIDLALGSVIDKKASPKEYTFLPEYIKKSFANTTRAKLDIPLVKQTKTLYKSKKQKVSNTFFSPFIITTIIALLIVFLTYFEYKKKKQNKILDFSILFLTGIIGLIIFLLWFATDHSATKGNFNILWAFLPNLIIAFTVFKNRKFQKNYYLFIFILILLNLIFWVFKIQVFNFAILPLLIALSVHYGYKYNSLKKLKSVK